MVNKYFKAGSLYMLGNVFDKALAFLTVPIFTKLLSTTDYGIASTYLSWVSIITVVITLSVGNSIRTAMVDFNESKDAYVSSIFILGTISSLAVSGVVIILNSIFELMTPWWLVLCCCVQSYSVSIIKAIDWKYVMELEYVKRTLLQCIPNLIIIVLAIFLILQRDNEKYLGKILAYVIVYSAVAFPLLIVALKRGKCYFNKGYWRYALSFSLPLIFHALSNVVLSQSDRIMITNMRDASETGLYSLAYQFGLIPLVIVTTLENLWIPWFTKKMQENNYDMIHRIVKYYVLIVVACCVLCMLLSPELLKLMAQPSYYDAAYLVAPIVLGTFFMFLLSIPLDMEYYYKKTGSIATNTLIAAGCNIVLNIIFIPKFGALAAAYTTAASYGLSFVMHFLAGMKIDSKFVEFTYYIPGICIVMMATIGVQLLISESIIRWAMAIVIAVASIPLSLRYLRVLKGKGE